MSIFSCMHECDKLRARSKTCPTISLNDMRTHAVACSELAQTLHWIVHLIQTSWTLASVDMIRNTDELVYLSREKSNLYLKGFEACRSYDIPLKTHRNLKFIWVAACDIARVLPGNRRAVWRGLAPSMSTTFASVNLHDYR